MPANPFPCSTCSFLVLLVPFLVMAAAAVNPQGESLLQWKRGWGGSAEALRSWDAADEAPCSWVGVTCDSNRKVVIGLELQGMDLVGDFPSNFTFLQSLTKLVLSGTNLTGSIPKEIAALRDLTHLDASDNALAGEIPDEISSLPKLQLLHLNSNRLEGSIPDGIGNLTSLKWLLLYDNQLGGAIPTSIGALRELLALRAGGNKNLRGSVPAEIGNCTNLQMLGLAETSVSGFLPPTLARLKKLRTIAIYTALLSGPIPAELGNCSDLENVYLYENALTGSIPSRLGNLRNLTSLLLWQNNIVGTLPPEIGGCPKLSVIDISMNSLTGSIPATFANLSSLQELQLSFNQISGQIPSGLGNCQAMAHIGLDNNQITGTIPSDLGNLNSLTLLFLWQNRLEGSIPSSLADCTNLEGIDLSQNTLTGPIPAGIFQLKSLNKLLLLSNNLSGMVPPEIGNCSSLVRFRAGGNMLTGPIPPEIGRLGNLNFLDLGSNHLTGVIPPEISGCRNLTFLDLHSNTIAGNLPESLDLLVSLQLLDVSDNVIEGTLSPGLGSLNSLTKLVLGRNRLSGPIPNQLGSCAKLQLLDLGSNRLSGVIPASVGRIPGLEIALNLSWNGLSGEIPAELAALTKLGVLDLSHNQLSGDLHYLASLQNLVALNISSNNFSGRVPDTPFFARLPLSLLAGNPSLCLPGNRCSIEGYGGVGPSRRAVGTRVAMALLLCAACALVVAALYVVLAARWHPRGIGRGMECGPDGGDHVEMGPPWEVTLYQKLDLSIDDVTRGLSSGNAVGRGRSGVVYKVTTQSGLSIAVKRFRVSEKFSAAAFSSEIATLARIRHRNIVRLLGWGANRTTKLLFYDYVPNGTLGALLHEGGGCVGLGGWEIRFKIALGVAEGLAYLHHDCLPPIVHRDVKAHNILLGDRYEPFLADFGLARLVEDDHGSFSASPQFAGSYGYFAPEYGCMLKITEKSDVYSYGIVLLEIITGKKPVDPSFPDGQHVVQWVRDHLKSKKDPVEILDPELQTQPDTHIQELLQALGISLLCTSNRAEDRPTMKDVAALLKGIRHEPPTGTELQKLNPGSGDKPDAPAYSSSSVVSPGQWLLIHGSSHCSLAYSSSAN